MSWGFTFGAVNLGWLFFRAPNLRQALTMFRAILTPRGYFHLSLRPDSYLIAFVVISGYFLFVGLESIFRQLADSGVLERGRWLLSPVFYAVAAVCILIWSGNETTFVYFRF